MGRFYCQAAMFVRDTRPFGVIPGAVPAGRLRPGGAWPELSPRLLLRPGSNPAAGREGYGATPHVQVSLHFLQFECDKTKDFWLH